MRNGLSGQQYHKHFFAMRIDITGRVSEPVDVLRKIVHVFLFRGALLM
jgi:hypothetical protein